jgi:hypothetical protein
MKTTSTKVTTGLLVLLGTAVFLGSFGCGGSGGSTPGSNDGSRAPNGNAQLLPPPTPTPTPAPACDDGAVNQRLLTEFNKPSNGFGPIKRTVNFYSRDCTVFVWGYAKNFRTYKRLERIIHDDSKTRSPATSVNMVNLELMLADYEPGAPVCATGFKPCNDICIPDDDPCVTQVAIATPSPSPSPSP